MTRIRSQLFVAATMASIALTSLSEAQGAAGALGPRPRGRQGAAPGASPARPNGAPQDAMRVRKQGASGNPAAMLLRMRGPLSLTDDQVKQLESMQNGARPKSNESDQLRARADLMDAMQGDGNLGKARTALDRMSTLRTDRMIAGLKVRQEARAVLTATQKQTLDNMRSQRAGKRGAMRGGRGQRRGGVRGAQGPRGQFGPSMGRPPMMQNGNRRGMRPPAESEQPPVTP